MYSTTQKEAEIPDHVLTLYNRAIINCASLPREKLVEAFAEIQGMYPHYPVPYLHWLAEVMSQDQRRNSATRSHHDGKGIDLPDRGAHGEDPLACAFAHGPYLNCEHHASTAASATTHQRQHPFRPSKYHTNAKPLAMDLDLRTPLDASLLPSTIAQIIATGGQARSGACTLCLAQLDSSSDDARDSIWDTLGCGRSHDQDRYIITTPPCRHQFHAGCFHHATQQGTGISICPVCRGKWYDKASDLQKARNVNYVITRMINGHYSSPHILGRTRGVELESYNLTESLVVAAYALRRSRSSHRLPEVVQHSRAVLTAVISHARSRDRARLDLHTFMNELSGRATTIIYGIYPYANPRNQDPLSQAVALQEFCKDVLTMGLGHYLTG
ncbi:hypothetical protein AC579_8469 [Pseudocercospora musae]|uniref:RING-type domain-containing protein n=1 Tax=Pseudocercospora musae TaxID=113226 RepID=A0A139I1V9_9PEZI|nr:hypothetical protein AC579_8469 [Pseudocercospora musae]